MYGKGRPSPTASGVSTGKIWRRKRSSSAALLLAHVDADDPDALVGERRAQVELEAAAARRSLCVRTTRRISSRVALGRAAVLQRGLDAGLDLVVQAGDPHHEELVEVRRHDRAELHALQQGDVVVLGQLEHARVEVEPRELAVEVQLGRGEIYLDPLGAGIGHDTADCDRSDKAKASRAANPLRS